MESGETALEESKWMSGMSGESYQDYLA